MKLRTLFVALSVGVAAIAACTVFDGLDNKVIGGDAGDASSDTGFDAGGNLQAGYLSLADGVAFCSNAFACPLLAESVEFSIDVPVDSNHFSSCIDWVSGPLPANRVGHDDTAKYLACSAKATTCLQATGCQWYEVLGTTDARCAGDAGAAACAEDGGAIYFCGSNPGVEHCTNGYYPTGYACTKGADNSLYCASPTCKGDQCSGAYLQFCGADEQDLQRLGLQRRWLHVRLRLDAGLQRLPHRRHLEALQRALGDVQRHDRDHLRLGLRVALRLRQLRRHVRSDGFPAVQAPR